MMDVFLNLPAGKRKTAGRFFDGKARKTQYLLFRDITIR